MKKKEIKFILVIFIVWRLLLFLIAAASFYLIPVFGAKFPYWDRVLTVTNLPNWIWGFGNFDGVHYLRLAQDGYQAMFSQAFFPLFPLVVRAVAFVLPKDPNLNQVLFVDSAFFWSGLFLSNLFLVVALYFFYKLIRLDFDDSTAKISLILLLVFPTSFFFGAIYTESLFLLLSVLAIYFLRQKKFLLCGVLISLACATKLFGVLLILVYLIEVWKFWKEKKIKINSEVLQGLLVAPLGLVGYMVFLKVNFNNAFYFFTSQSHFGANRSDTLVFLPQVLYRYLKIFMTVRIFSSAFLSSFFEFVFTCLVALVLILLFKKMRLSYWVFCLSCLFVPTLTGTLTSMPRYALMCFLILPLIANFKASYYKLLIALFVFLGTILLSLFIRGYWVA